MTDQSRLTGPLDPAVKKTSQSTVTHFFAPVDRETYDNQVLHSSIISTIARIENEAVIIHIPYYYKC